MKYFLWLNPDRCGLFFANHVLLVEGQAEQTLIRKLLGDGKINGAECGLYVLDCLGKYNIHRFMNLLVTLGTPHSVLYDDDLNANEHKDLNELIGSSRHISLTLEIKTIYENIKNNFWGFHQAVPHIENLNTFSFFMKPRRSMRAIFRNSVSWLKPVSLRFRQMGVSLLQPCKTRLRMRRSITQLDHQLAIYYDLTDEKVDFIPSTSPRAGINYDIKYRMGQGRTDDDGS